jgi:tetratricopeptide (TPR) repeat protein
MKSLKVQFKKASASSIGSKISKLRLGATLSLLWASVALSALFPVELRAQSSSQPSSTPSTKPSSPKKKTKPAEDQPAKSLTPEEKEAQFHYKVALTALKNDDLEVAIRELETAANLAPSNALVQYNLAVVKSKNARPAEALINLKRAIDLGLPSDQAKAADDLLVQLTYQSQKSVSSKYSWLIGRWIGHFTSRLRTKDLKCIYTNDNVQAALDIARDTSNLDNLTGRFTFSATSYSWLLHHEEYCQRQFEEPSAMHGTAIYRITQIKEDKDESVTIVGVQSSCDGDLMGYTSYNAHTYICGFGGDEKELTFTLKRADMNRLNVSGSDPLEIGVFTKQQ